MCISPFLIKNPHYIHSSGSSSVSRNETYMSKFYNTKDTYIAVPCGHCMECLSLRQSYITQRCREEFKYSHCFMVTLTYNNAMRPFKMLGNFKHYYFDVRDFQLFVKRIRKNSLLPPFKYIAFTEYGGENHLPHIHALFYFSKSLFDDLTPLELEDRFIEVIKSEWKRKVGGTSFDPIYKPLSSFIRYFDNVDKIWKGTFDVHYVVNDYGNSSDPTDVAYYCSKYCLKYDEWLEAKRGMLWHNYIEDYRSLWKIFRPHMLVSKGFGVFSENGVDFTADFIKQCISTSKQFNAIVPQYITDDGNFISLSRYYQQKYLSPDDRWFFIVNSPNAFIPFGKEIPDDATLVSKTYSLSDLEFLRTRSKLFDKQLSRIYDESDYYLTSIEPSDSIDKIESSLSITCEYNTDFNSFLDEFDLESPLNPHHYD